MKEEAIAKLRDEMEKNQNNPYIKAVGGFLLQHLETNPDSAEKILAADKTIGKSLDEMKKVAEKNKVGNCAVLTDQEGFEIVLKYFGIEGKAPEVVNTSSSEIQKSVEEAPGDNINFDISLDDLF